MSAGGPAPHSTAVLDQSFMKTALNIMLEQATPEFTKHWQEAKQRLGDEAAGSTLVGFITKNTKIIDFDPWDTRRSMQTHLMKEFGSDNPFTYDVLMITGDFAETTEYPAIFTDAMSYQVFDKVFLFKRGVWIYEAIPPRPGRGLQLEEWETTFTATARFTMPFEK